MRNPISPIAQAINEGLSLWKAFITTRQEAYNRKQDRRKRKAIEYAEKYILLNESNSPQKDKEKRLKKYRKAFLKYNN